MDCRWDGRIDYRGAAAFVINPIPALACGSHGQFAVLYSFNADKAVGDFLDFMTPALNNEYFQKDFRGKH